MSNAERGAAAGGAADGGAAGQGDAAGHGGVSGGGVSRDGGATNAVEQTLRHLRTLDAPVAETEDTSSQGPLTLEDLYKQHRMRLVRLAILLVDEPATAEDVVQEAFTGLHRNWAKLRDAAAAVGYLRAAVVNGSRSVLRRRKTAREYVPPHAVNARSAESLAMLSTEHQAVVKALSQLPPRQREVLVLRYYGGLSESEISEATGISKGTVKSTASRALEALQRTMPDSKR
ncbi:RNA polymerase sigma-70 factor, sigma-E family [Prauserella aidingensis]|uniref:RNA polymerase sigma factor n=1 Tax=Prauserella aidingensis TaxID=387890 RepID=UPI0020A4E5B2|nr:SigE family RNA polymerase sigma factor [Prauserella aidingensis]MCP2253441.1 RNA polymerase sigma-70 factor, sigma-E family [Prauserella aidingensis]